MLLEAIGSAVGVTGTGVGGTGGPVGVETLSAALSESRDALEDVIEPYLLQQGLVQRTPRGRMLGQRGWDHLGMRAPKSETGLFN